MFARPFNRSFAPTRLLLLFGLFLPTAVALADVRVAFLRERDGEKHVYVMDGKHARPRPITEGKRWHLYPALSADGKRLAWAEGADDKDLQIVVEEWNRAEAKATREQWTSRPGRHLHPRFSGDGRFLAFAGPYGPEGASRVAVVKVAEAKAAKADRLGPLPVRHVEPTVVPSEYPAYFPALASDGSFVVFQRSKPEGKKDLVRYRFQDGETTVLTPADGNCMAPALSFDDRFLAYTALVDGNWDIYVLDLSAPDRGATRVTDAEERDFAPRFLPDGGLLFASARGGGRFRLHEIPADEMRFGRFRARLFLDSEADDYAPTVSGDLRFDQGRLPAMTEPPRSSFGTARLGDVVYVAGGHQGREHTYPPESFLDILEAFDLKTGTWRRLAPRPVAAHGYGIAATERVVDGKSRRYVYAFGGFTYSDAHRPRWKSVPFIDRYDVDANRWERVGELSAPRSSNVVVPVGDKVYLIGGWDSTPKHDGDLDGKFVSTIEIFDLVTETVSTSEAKLPAPLRRATTAVVVGDEIVLVGGIGEGASHFELLDTVTAFRPSTGKWRELPRLPFKTFAPAVGAIGSDLFVFGGGLFTEGGKQFRYVNHVFALPEGAGRLHHTGRYLAEPKGFSMVVPVAPRTLGVFGGHNYEALEGDGPVRTVELFSQLRH